MQQKGIGTVLYADKTPEQLRDGRLPNNVCRFGRTRARERALGVDHWDFPDFGMSCAHVRVHGEGPVAFLGELTEQASFVDFRLYLPRLLADYRERGGTVIDVPDPVTAVARHADGHDLLVVAAGRQGLGALFPRVPDRSADAPARLLFAGLFHGVAHTEPMGMHFDIVPGAGEIFQTPVGSVTGRVAGITFEALPDGPWAGRLRERYYDDPDACARVVLDLLRESGSEILDRVDPARFALTRPLDLLQGAITPTVRRPWAKVSARSYAVAVGDAAVLNDPVTGQGGNLASAAAWELGHTILAAKAFDENFRLDWENRLWNLARDVTEWTASALGPPPAHVMDLLRAAGENQALANAFLDNFDAPHAMWASVATPEQAAAFTRRFITVRDADHEVVDHEQRLLDALGHDDGDALDPVVAADAVLVVEDGCHARETWQKAARAAGQATGFSMVNLTATSRLVTYRQGPVHCFTLWRREPGGTWAAVVHHRSPEATS